MEKTLLNLNVEVYKENGKTYLYLADDCSSGAKYEVENTKHIGKIIGDYILNTYGEVTE